MMRWLSILCMGNKSFLQHKPKKYISIYNLTDWDKKCGVSGSVVSRVFSPGTYVVTASAIKVRIGPSITYPQRAFKDMTASAQRLNAAHESSGLAVYDNGTRFTALAIHVISDKEVWAKTPSGYVALMHNGNEYVEKI